MISEKQLEANRRNAQKSTGPRTELGKEQSRANALRHGLRARAFDVLPNEDPAEFQARLDAWAADLEPGDQAEARVVRHIASLDWRKERLDRHEHALLSKKVREAMIAAEDAGHARLVAAYEQLLPEAYAEHTRYQADGPDGLNLGLLREDVEASAEGCRWLLEVWAPMLRQARSGKYWTPSQEFLAIRLLSRGPEPRITDPEILDFAVANRMLMIPGAQIVPESLTEGMGVSFSSHAMMLACVRKPSDQSEAAALLARVAEKEIARLEGVLATRERDGDLNTRDAEEAGLLAMFDPGTEGERLRRYQLSLDRELRRALEALAKLRKEREKREAHGANEAISEVVRQECRTHATDDVRQECRTHEPPAPNEPISGPDVQFLFAPDRDRAVEPVKPAAPNEPNRPDGPMSKRQRALARLARRTQSGR